MNRLIEKETIMNRAGKIAEVLEKIILEQYQTAYPDKESEAPEIKRWWMRHALTLIHADVYTILQEAFHRLNHKIAPENLWKLTQNIFNEMIFLPPNSPLQSFVSVATAYLQRVMEINVGEPANLRDQEFFYDRLKHLPAQMIEDMISIKEKLAWLEYAMRFPDRHLFLTKVRAIPLISEEKKDRLIGLIFEGKLGLAVRFLSKISGKSRVHIPKAEYTPKEIKKALRKDKRRRKQNTEDVTTDTE